MLKYLISWIEKMHWKRIKRERWVDPKLYADVPDPLIPWEIYGHIDPDILRCTQGFSEYWRDHILTPYWTTLTDDQQQELLAKAPTQSWREWMERSLTPDRIEGIRAYHIRHGIPFDHTYHLETFMVAYATAQDAYKL